MADAFNNFSAIGGNLQKQLSQIVRVAAFNIQAAAQQNAPVRTGYLKNSIHTEDGANDLEQLVVVGANYGIYVEFGTYKMAAQPYLTPAVEGERSAFEGALAGLKWTP